MTTETKNAIFAVIIIVLIIGMLILFFPKTILPWLKSLGGEKMSLETKNSVVDSFDTLVENLDICQTMEDDSCFCDTLPSFPGVFHPKAILKVDNTVPNLTLYDQTTELKSLEIEPTLRVLSVEESSGTFVSHRLSMPSVFNVLFSEKVPRVKETMRGYVVSSLGLKESDGIYLLTFYNKGVSDNPNFLERPFIGSKNVPKDADLAAIKSTMEKMPKCQEGRRDAIKFLTEIDTELGKKLIELPQEFIIKFNNKEAWLESNGNKVYAMKNSIMNGNGAISSEEAKRPITLCTSSSQSGELQNSMTLDIKEENNKRCIFV